MERSTTVRGFRVTAEMGNGYDLERQLAIAEKRYAEARGAADKARAEWRTLMTQAGANPAAVRAAQAQFEAVAARCGKLRDLIERLEERIEG